jgi:hypothetical protein
VSPRHQGAFLIRKKFEYLRLYVHPALATCLEEGRIVVGQLPPNIFNLIGIHCLLYHFHHGVAVVDSNGFIFMFLLADTYKEFVKGK